MPARKNKLKTLYLLKILLEESDGLHGLTMPQLIGRLADYDISAERKSVYSDIETLREFNVDVITLRRSPVQYAINRRDFSLDELMLIVDAIQSCPAITDEQSDHLVAGVKKLTSKYLQERLDRRIHVRGRVKSQDESVFVNVDLVHEAMRLRSKIEFSYENIGSDGRRGTGDGGEKCVVTPVGITCDGGYYFLTAWNDEQDRMTEYRLDRMAEVFVLEDQPASRNMDISGYHPSKSRVVSFGRLEGEEVTATLLVKADMVNVVTDSFGDAAIFLGSEGDGVRMRVRVRKNDLFFGWLAGTGKFARIVSPQYLVDEYREYLQSLLETRLD